MKFSINNQIFLLLIFLNICGIYTSNEELDLSIEEEAPLNSILIDLIQKFSSDYTSFYLEDSFFSINQEGKLEVKSNIDLDSMCINHQKCCGEEQCYLFLTVYFKIKHSDADKFIKIKVLVKDINDNAPRFATRLQKLSVSEFAGIGKLISLLPAQDMDFDKKNGIRNYTFFEASKTFDLDQTKIGSPALIITGSLDFERKRGYNAAWVACDYQSRCDKQEIIIDIVDENDNSPKFEEKKLTLRIPEDFHVGKVVTKLNATDRDSSPYNQIKYGFWEASSDRNIQYTFIVTENTGEIRLKEKLNTRIRAFYKFKIFAEDANGLNMEKDFIEIELHIIDVNDHAPTITLVNAKLPVTIKENSDPSYILSLKVSDNDFGANGNVSCNIGNENKDFRLLRSSEHLYSVRSKRSFDFEHERSIAFSINCFDKGSPPKASQKIIEVKIIDENEYHPQFAKDTYQQNILENKLEGHFVLKVQAFDRDAGATLFYKLDDNVQGFFTIERMSGEIRTGAKIIDREENERFQFTVSVFDSEEKPFVGKTSVTVVIIDENDNAPQFTTHFHFPKFSMLENSPIMTPFIQQINATDRDMSDANSKIQFTVERTFDFFLNEISETFFTISNMGTISNIKIIDREVYPNFTITVKVHDNGSPPLSSYMNITLHIEDQNDNSPVFMNSVKDSQNEMMINISSDKTINSVLTSLKAIDNDDGLNGEVVYGIIGDVDNTLGMNSSSGEIQLLRKVFHGPYIFTVQACDRGHPKRVTNISVILNVYGDEMNMLNSTIIILLLTITGIISLFLIIAITCVRRRPRSIPSFRHSGSDIQKSLQNDSPTKYDEHTNNTSIYYPSNFDRISIVKSDKLPMESIERDILITSNFLPYNPNVYSEFTMVPSYLPPCLNIESLTPTFRSNERDDDSGDSGKGGSEDDVALANLQLGQSGLEHLEFGIKGHGCSAASPNTRSLNFHRFNYRSRNPTTFHMVPEDELVQNHLDANTYSLRGGQSSTGFIDPTYAITRKSYSCVNSDMNNSMPLMPDLHSINMLTDLQTLGSPNSMMRFRDQTTYPSTSSFHMCFDKS